MIRHTYKKQAIVSFIVAVIKELRTCPDETWQISCFMAWQISPIIKSWTRYIGYVAFLLAERS